MRGAPPVHCFLHSSCSNHWRHSSCSHGLWSNNCLSCLGSLLLLYEKKIKKKIKKHFSIFHYIDSYSNHHAYQIFFASHALLLMTYITVECRYMHIIISDDLSCVRFTSFTKRLQSNIGPTCNLLSCCCFSCSGVNCFCCCCCRKCCKYENV